MIARLRTSLSQNIPSTTPLRTFIPITSNPIQPYSTRRSTRKYPSPMSQPPSDPSSSSTSITPQEQINILANTIKQLKLDKKPFDGELKEMLRLKAEVGQSVGGSGDGKKGKMVLKTPKGTKDQPPHHTLLRKGIFSTLENIFLKHGASTIDTPVFELKEILSGKYGEDSKLIYDLQDQGGELCSLRYDLTVPFARFLAMNGTTYPSMKRYHIGKVYRRDQPALSKGRMREFYQCDFDIAGTFDPMVPDAEVLCVVCEGLTALDIGDFTIKLNHRKILDGIFQLCGVPKDKIRAISSAVDKLDKSPWTEVRREMTEDKGLDPAIADHIGEYVKLKGPGKELLQKLQADEKLSCIKTAKQGMADMELLFGYLEIFGVLDKMSFDMSLARGLDYYTGIIYEAVHESSAPPAPKPITTAPPPASKKSKSTATNPDAEPEIDESTIGVGSIAAGGRYDELVGMFHEASGGKSGSGKIPCVGVSVGVERVFSIMLAKRAAEAAARGEGKARDPRAKETQVFVVSAGGDGLLKERMGLCKELWDSGIKAEFAYKLKPKLPAQLDACDKDQTPYTVIIGPSEISSGTVRVRRQLLTAGGGKGDEKGEVKEKGEGEVVKREGLVGYLKKVLEEEGL